MAKEITTRELLIEDLLPIFWAQLQCKRAWRNHPYERELPCRDGSGNKISITVHELEVSYEKFELFPRYELVTPSGARQLLWDKESYSDQPYHKAVRETGSKRAVAEAYSGIAS